MEKNEATKKCDGCEKLPVAFYVNLTDADGVLIDRRGYCKWCIDGPKIATPVGCLFPGIND